MMNVLYISSSIFYHINMIFDYDNSFNLYSKNKIYYLDVSQNELIPLSKFDAIIFSPFFFARTWDLSQPTLNIFKNFRGLKVAIFHDEYTSYIRHRSNIKHINVDAIVTLVPKQYWKEVFYDQIGPVPLMQALSGYIPENLLQCPPPLPFQHRRWHIGYRGRDMSYFYGKLTREKYTIGLDMRDICIRHGIPANIDVTEDSRIYGADWVEFIRNSRAMLGTESGSNVFDFSGTLFGKIQTYLSSNPGASFDEIHELFLKDIDGAILMNQIAPKMFEAIALGTALILFEGDYSGILKPWKHYIPLKKDFSNIDLVLQALDDIPLLEKMTQQAMEDIVFSQKYGYRQFIMQIDKLLDQLPAHPVNSKIAPSGDIPKNVTLKPIRWDAAALQIAQTKMDAHCRCLAQKLSGKKVLFFGAGSAYRYYKQQFKNIQPIGIFVDEPFRNEAKTTLESALLLSADDLKRIPYLDNIVVFAKQEFIFFISERIKQLFPDGPSPDYCTLITTS